MIVKNLLLRFDRPGLRHDDVSLLKRVMGVDVGGGERGGSSRLYGCPRNSDLGFTGFAHMRIHRCEDQHFVVERRRTPEPRKGSWVRIALVVYAGRREYSAQRLAALMCRVHVEHVADRGDAELIFVRQVEAVQTVDQLGTVGHRDFFRVLVEQIQRHPAEDRVAQGWSLLQDVARRHLATGPIPRTPFIHHQLNVVFTIDLAHDLPVSGDQRFHHFALPQ